MIIIIVIIDQNHFIFSSYNPLGNLLPPHHNHIHRIPHYLQNLMKNLDFNLLNGFALIFCL
jgi:hypothetical protein